MSSQEDEKMKATFIATVLTRNLEPGCVPQLRNATYCAETIVTLQTFIKLQREKHAVVICMWSFHDKGVPR
jgi:hypothetical protein